MRSEIRVRFIELRTVVEMMLMKIVGIKGMEMSRGPVVMVVMRHKAVCLDQG